LVWFCVFGSGHSDHVTFYDYFSHGCYCDCLNHPHLRPPKEETADDFFDYEYELFTPNLNADLSDELETTQEQEQQQEQQEQQQQQQ
jgi:hypothetical protein